MTTVIDLLPDATPTADDLVYVVNDPGGTPSDRKVTLQNLATALAGMSGGAYVDLVNPQTVGGVKTFTSDPIIPDEAYGVGWNGVLEPPTKNAVYDALSAIPTLDTATPASLNVYTAAGVTYVDFIGAAGGSVFADNAFRIEDNADNTKDLVFDLGLAAAGTTTTVRAQQTASRLLVLPDVDGTLLATTGDQTVTGRKTMSGLTALRDTASGRMTGVGNTSLGTGAELEIFGYIDATTGKPEVMFMHAHGNIGAETQTQAGALIGSVIARGYTNAAAYSSGNHARHTFRATENVTATTRGTAWDLLVTPTGTATITKALEVSADAVPQVKLLGPLVVNGGAGFVSASSVIGLQVTGGVQMIPAALTLVNGLNDNIVITAPIMIVTGPTAAFDLGGFVNAGGVAPQNGQRIVVIDRTGFVMSAINESLTSTAANRIVTMTGGTVSTTGGEGVMSFVYDGVSGTPRWVREGTVV